MKLRNLLVTFLALFIALSGVRADTCQFTFKCQGSLCERVQPSSCTPSTATAGVVITSPAVTSPIGVVAATNSPATSFVFRSSDVSKSPENLPSAPISGVGCAENGSCYGEISNINGTPKTTHVNGYFRSDGTYVRGHYRSSGRR
jgi:hypothetical protein